MLKYASIALKFFSLGLVIAAGAFWAGAEVNGRPKYRDEQTLVGGAVWAQTIIPVGLIISTIIDEELYVFVHAYFLITGVLLLVTTGLVLIIGEYKSMHRQRQAIPTLPSPVNVAPSYDKIYYAIGILSLLAGISTLLITGLLAFGAYWTTKYLMNMPEATTPHPGTDIKSTMYPFKLHNLSTQVYT